MKCEGDGRSGLFKDSGVSGFLGAGMILALFMAPIGAVPATAQEVDLAGAIDELSSCLSSSFTQWSNSITFQNVVINADSGRIVPSQMTVGKRTVFQNCVVASSRNEATRNLVKSVARGVEAKLNNWSMLYQGVLQYPLGKQCPSPSMPASPNVPVPVMAGTPSSLQFAWGELSGYLGHTPSTTERTCMEAAAWAFANCFWGWISNSRIENVIGLGGHNPSFRPPNSIVGPIVDARGNGGGIVGQFAQCQPATLKQSMRLKANLPQ